MSMRTGTPKNGASTRKLQYERPQSQSISTPSRPLFGRFIRAIDELQCPDFEVRTATRPLVYRLQNRRDTGKSTIPGRFWFRSPHDDPAAALMRASDPP